MVVGQWVGAGGNGGYGQHRLWGCRESRESVKQKEKCEGERI